MKNYYCALLMFFLIFLPGKVVVAQISLGGKAIIENVTLPDPPVVEFPAPDLVQLKKEDDLNAEKQRPYRVAVALPANCDFIQNAQPTKTAEGNVWRLMLRSRGAKALSVTFSKFVIPTHGKLFLYDVNLKKKIGAFTAENNIEEGSFAVELLPGESIIMEYSQPNSVTALPQLIISELLYVYRSSGFLPTSTLKDFGNAGSCEVNINCVEGLPYSSLKQGVVRLLIRSGTGAFWCSGSIMNNTSRDFKPYILTAEHCWEGTALSDFDKWLTYFNYEAPGCANLVIAPVSVTMTGANLVSRSGTGTNESDFMLVQLKQSIPLAYNAWYMGWSRETVSNPGAVCIHHPGGDIKKISFVLNSPVGVSSYGGTPDPNGTYWQVNWHSTVSGFGVTEGGSSGSPLINVDGKVIGTLSGGGSDCLDTGQKDYFGKVSAHWAYNGTNIANQLGPWLDPQNLGISSYLGSYHNNNVIAQFSADGVIIPPGSSVNFSDRSFGTPNSWSWTFTGGVPSTSTAENPSGVSYNKTGSYDVRLIAGNSFQSDTVLIKGYIQVRAPVYPNPTKGPAELLISKEKIPQIDVQVSNVQGMVISKFTATNTNIVSFDFTNQPRGMYFITVFTAGNSQTYKIVVSH